MKTEEGHRSYRDLILNRQPYPHLSSFKGIIAGLLSYAIALPIIGKLLRKSFVVTCFALGRYRQKGNYIGLYTLLLNSLIDRRYQNKNSYQWWYLMRFAVAVAQERQINFFCERFSIRRQFNYVGKYRT